MELCSSLILNSIFVCCTFNKKRSYFKNKIRGQQHYQRINQNLEILKSSDLLIYILTIIYIFIYFFGTLLLCQISFLQFSYLLAVILGYLLLISRHIRLYCRLHEFSLRYIPLLYNICILIIINHIKIIIIGKSVSNIVSI